MVLGAVAVGLSGTMAACGGGGAKSGGPSSTTTEAAVSTSSVVEEPVATTPTSASAADPTKVPATSGRPPATSPPAGPAATATTLRSGETRVQATVGTVDAAAGTFTLVERPSGFGVVAVNGATEFRLSESEPASFANVKPGTFVSVSGAVVAPGRVLARRVVIL